MSFISPELYKQIQEKPQETYSVLITLKGALPAELESKGNFVMPDKIFSAKMSGREIQGLMNHSGVEAIEPDMEMHIL